MDKAFMEEAPHGNICPASPAVTMIKTRRTAVMIAALRITLLILFLFHSNLISFHMMCPSFRRHFQKIILQIFILSSNRRHSDIIQRQRSG